MREENAIENKSLSSEAESYQEDEELKEMPLLGHLQELRKRIILIFVFSFLGFCVCYGFAEEIFAFIMSPLLTELANRKLIFTSLPEAFFVYVKVSFLAGMFLMSPFIFYQIWAFIAPGLYREEKAYAVGIGVFSGLFFIGGGAFCYYNVFPVAFRFFLGFSNAYIEAMPSLDISLSFALKLLFAFGLIAQMPLFAFFLGRLGIISVHGMNKFRKYFILLAFIIGAILTPPDIISQIMMSIPMVLLYEFSICIVFFLERSAMRKRK